jgi:hypothetical protein
LFSFSGDKREKSRLFLWKFTWTSTQSCSLYRLSGLSFAAGKEFEKKRISREIDPFHLSNGLGHFAGQTGCCGSPAKKSKA